MRKGRLKSAARLPLAARLLDAGAVQGVSLPQLVGKLHGKGQPVLLDGFGLQQLVLVHHGKTWRVPVESEQTSRVAATPCTARSWG